MPEGGNEKVSVVDGGDGARRGLRVVMKNGLGGENSRREPSGSGLCSGRSKGDASRETERWGVEATEGTATVDGMRGGWGGSGVIVVAKGNRAASLPAPGVEETWGISGP